MSINGKPSNDEQPQAHRCHAGEVHRPATQSSHQKPGSNGTEESNAGPAQIQLV